MKGAQAQELKSIINEMVAELEQIKTKPAPRQPHRRQPYHGRSKEVIETNYYDQSYHPEQDQNQYGSGVTNEHLDFKRPSKDKNKDNFQERPRPTEENVVEYNLLTGPELVDKIEFEEDSISEKDVVEFEFEPIPEEPAAEELTREERIKSYLKKADRCSKRGIHDETAKYYDMILALDPKHVEALINKGLLLWGDRKYRLAIEQYDQVLEIEPNNQEALINKAASLNRLGKKDLALEIYDDLLEQDDTNADAWSNKGVIYFSLDRFQDAETCFKNAVEHNVFNEESWFNLGFVLEKLGNYTKAKDAYDNVLGINPDNEEAMHASEQCAKAARREMLSSWD